MPSPMDLVLTRQEAARTLKLSERTLQRLEQSGQGPARTILTDRRVGYTVSAIERWLQSRQVGG